MGHTVYILAARSWQTSGRDFASAPRSGLCSRVVFITVSLRILYYFTVCMLYICILSINCTRKYVIRLKFSAFLCVCNMGIMWTVNTVCAWCEKIRKRKKEEPEEYFFATREKWSSLVLRRHRARTVSPLEELKPFFEFIQNLSRYRFF